VARQAEPRSGWLIFSPRPNSNKAIGFLTRQGEPIFLFECRAGFGTEYKVRTEERAAVRQAEPRSGWLIFPPRPIFPPPDQFLTAPSGRPLSYCRTGLREFSGECWSHVCIRALLYRPSARTLILSQILPECLETTCDIGATSDDSYLVELPPWVLTKR